MSPSTVLVTGATGYIGGRLVPRLLAAGYRVRCLARSPKKLEARAWAGHPEVEIVQGDLSDPASIERALRGCSAAYYLVHSMVASGADYAEQDRRLARSFATAASGEPSMKRIIYLGGLGETGGDLSEHLSSRREVERELASGSVPVTTLRAAMIIGSGSASFEILRYLVERLPVMVTPRWVQTESQPIAVRNVLEYLVRALEVEETTGRVLDIGGPEVLSYRRLMEVMAEALGLPRRIVLPVPVLTPRLSSLWIHLVTPLSHRIARPLAEGLRNRVVCRSTAARELMPQELPAARGASRDAQVASAAGSDARSRDAGNAGTSSRSGDAADGPAPPQDGRADFHHGLLSVREAIDAALGQYDSDGVETSWTDAGPIPGDPDWAGGTTFDDRRTTEVAAPPAAVFRAICRIGGGNGWYAADLLWRVRGWLDRLVGGPGLRRGRRDPERLAYGDALDFWRVTGIEEGKRLELRAEMKLPGEAVLEFDIAEGARGSLLTQTARFKPRGLTGLVYWVLVLPFHGFVFRGMLRGIRRTAETLPPSAAPQATAAR